MHTTLSNLSLYDEAYQKKIAMQDEMLWLNGLYTYEAISIICHNLFSKKGETPLSYRDKPILDEIRNMSEELSEEEKKTQIQILFANLKIMQDNFEKSHGDK